MHIIELIEQQSPFLQGLIASALFGLSVWLLRVIAKRLGKTGSVFLKLYQKDLLTRHWLHKNYVNSDNILLYTQGFNFVVLQTIRWVLRGTLIFIFFLGVNTILNSEWLWAACAWFVFNAFFEAYQWAKDTSSEEYIAKIDDDVKNEFFEYLLSSKSNQDKLKDEGS